MKTIPMVTITNISDRQIEVNGKTVIQDMNGQWITRDELTPAESKSLNNYIKSI